MTLSIFWRLMLSHIGILVLSGAACLYSIVQLGSLSGTARGALDTNHRMIAYQEALIDAFLSQVRYGGKYLITHTESRHEQARQFKKDFLNYLHLLKELDTAEMLGPSLSRIDRLHDHYHELFAREAAFIRTRQPYAQTRFQQERDRIVEETLGELDTLKAQTRARLQEKLEMIDHGARTARRIATATTLVVLVLGGLLSLKVSRSMDSATARLPLPPPLAKIWTLALEIGGLSMIQRWMQKTKLYLSNWSAFALGRIGTWYRRS